MKLPEQFTLPIKYDYNGTHFFDAEGRMILQIRGWGYLTGTGGLRLEGEQAVKIQDATAHYIETAVNSYERMRVAIETVLRHIESHQVYDKGSEIILRNALTGEDEPDSVTIYCTQPATPECCTFHDRKSAFKKKEFRTECIWTENVDGFYQTQCSKFPNSPHDWESEPRAFCPKCGRGVNTVAFAI